jgi:hypothetical protein
LYRSAYRPKAKINNTTASTAPNMPISWMDMIGIYRRKSSKQYSEVLRIAQLPTFYEFSTDNEVVKRCARTVHLADYGFSTTCGYRVEKPMLYAAVSPLCARRASSFSILSFSIALNCPSSRTWCSISFRALSGGIFWLSCLVRFLNRPLIVFSAIILGGYFFFAMFSSLSLGRFAVDFVYQPAYLFL